MYFATLSDLANEPVLICVEFVATAKSAIKVSSESPDLCDMIVFKPFQCKKKEKLKNQDLEIHVPPLDLTTDNGAMIALAAYHQLKTRPNSDWTTDAQPYLPLAN